MPISYCRMPTPKLKHWDKKQYSLPSPNAIIELWNHLSHVAFPVRLFCIIHQKSSCCSCFCLYFSIIAHLVNELNSGFFFFFSLHMIKLLNIIFNFYVFQASVHRHTRVEWEQLWIVREREQVAKSSSFSSYFCDFEVESLMTFSTALKWSNNISLGFIITTPI